MATIYVTRSKTLSDWGYDVGLGKHIYKIGLTEEPVKELVAAGWAGAADWVLVKKQDGVDGLTEETIHERVAGKLKLIEPRLYPKIRETPGIFKVAPAQVENHMMVTRALADEPQIRDIKVKPADIATYMIACGLG